MKQICVGGYKRITKSTAKKLYDEGETIRICAVNLSPINAWGEHCDVNNRGYARVFSDGFNTTVARNKKFETVVNSFAFYNCNANTGRYPAFYIKNV